MRKITPLLTYDAVKEKALRLLDFRAHSEKELCDKLRRLEASEENISAVVEFCRSYGFLNDEAYALSKAKDLFKLKKLGKFRIRAELKNLGIDDDIIDIAVSELDEDEERAAMKKIAEKKLNGDFSYKNKDKCIRHLAYKGYDIYDIKDVIGELEDEYEI